MRQAESGAIKSSECQGMAKRLLRSRREIGCEQYRARLGEPLRCVTWVESNAAVADHKAVG